MIESDHQIITDHIITDDLAFSAYLKMRGHRLITCNHRGSKTIFTFSVNADGSESGESAERKHPHRPENGESSGDGRALKVEFINSPFLQYYNELRNLKKII